MEITTQFDTLLTEINTSKNTEFWVQNDMIVNLE
jgi:hypothetical protein